MILNDSENRTLHSLSTPVVAKYDAAIIVPMRNSGPYIRECLNSITRQVSVDLSRIELVMYDDASTDDTVTIVRSLINSSLSQLLGSVRLICGTVGPQGCGSSRNRAIEESTAAVLVFLDSDDVMMPTRLSRTMDALKSGDGDGDDCSPCLMCLPKRTQDGSVGVIGGNFQRIPLGSTPRYEAYHRRIEGSTNVDCELFAYAFRDAPLAMPTVSCLRTVWEKCGKFIEGPHVSEDLVFQYSAMKCGFTLAKLGGKPLVQYRYHSAMTSKSLSLQHMLEIRVAAFEDLVLQRPQWASFSIWGAGRDGKKIFKLLSDASKDRVVCWGDINPRKIGSRLHGKPVVHFSRLKPPIAACVALDRTDGDFETNLRLMNFSMGKDCVFLV